MWNCPIDHKQTKLKNTPSYVVEEIVDKSGRQLNSRHNMAPVWWTRGNPTDASIITDEEDAPDIEIWNNVQVFTEAVHFTFTLV